MDVHQATISAAVWDSSGNLVVEATLETRAETTRHMRRPREDRLSEFLFL
jgi:hypothetical protein